MHDDLCAKLRNLGPDVLSTPELLAIFLAETEEEVPQALPIATQLLRDGGHLRFISTLPPDILKERTGLEGHRANQFYALLELGRRIENAGKGKPDPVNNPEDVVRMFRHLRDARKEHFCAILLDAKNQVIKTCTIHIGTVSSAVVGVREFFREAVREGASGVIAVHNHPSGDPTPSREDIAVTRTLKEAGSLLEIPLLDHIIIGENRFVSLLRLGHL
ncbi:MAG: DNA repair protein RadC [Fimbriimonadales bacterium]|nr:DNA repair protein RadC [Fimbriimonadales bacterium]